MKQGKPLVLVALSAVPFVMVLGNSMLIPILPAMERALDISAFQSSLVITLFSVPAGLIIPLSGFLSDYFSRKVVMIPALLLYGAGGLIAGTASLIDPGPTYAVILGGRILQGIGAAGTAPIAMALTGDLFIEQARARALGIIEAANGIGKVVSPVLGAAVGLIVWFAPFFVFPAFTVIAAVLIWLAVKEPQSGNARPAAGAYFKDILRVFEKKTGLLAACFLAGAVALFTLFGILFFLSDHLESRYQLTLLIKGLVLAIPVLFMSVTAYLTGLFIKKKVKLMKVLIITGAALMTAALIALPLCRNTYFFFTAISVIGVGVGLILPCLTTLITGSVGTAKRGLITSLYGSVRFFGVAAGPPLFSLLLEPGLKTMGWSVAGLTLATGLVALLFIKTGEIIKGNSG